MKAVILAAGKGTRMGDLSSTIPKPMLRILNKTLIEHKVEILPKIIDEIILVVGHLKEMIIGTLGQEILGRKISYVVQDELRGTAHSLLLCKDLLIDEGKFLVLMGDDIYSGKDVTRCIENPWSILISEMPTVKGKAEVYINKDGSIDKIQEKSTNDKKGFVCAGMYCVGPEIFSYPLVPVSPTEYGLPQTIISASKRFPAKPIITKEWIQITSPDDLVLAEKIIL